VRAEQALSLAYFEVFTFSACGVMLTFFVLIMRRSVAEKGAHIGAEQLEPDRARRDMGEI
jgi:DHA2 family multidrug resistance protein